MVFPEEAYSSAKAKFGASGELLLEVCSDLRHLLEPRVHRNVNQACVERDDTRAMDGQQALAGYNVAITVAGLARHGIESSTLREPWGLIRIISYNAASLAEPLKPAMAAQHRIPARAATCKLVSSVRYSPQFPSSQYQSFSLHSRTSK